MLCSPVESCAEEFPVSFPLVADPKFSARGKGKEGYRLLKNSPAINNGAAIEKNASVDYYKNKISNTGKLNIGIDENKNR